jgi:tetratricopeptide (TPR) repeat protein
MIAKDSRDDFSRPTIEQLAKRVGYRCSNPGCGRLTSGPRDHPEKSVNIGVAAHITAASPGGARYDPTLTQTERRSVSNGIWLCQDHAKLVDNDAERYTVDLLRDWKKKAEEHARRELEHPAPPTQSGPTLIIPSPLESASWLSYVSQSTTFSERTEELRLLKTFLQADERFLWWSVTGPAGSGKSRLALEFCQTVRNEWDAGFLSRVESFSGWTQWHPTRPTLLVVDYVSGRVTQVSNIVLQLARVKRSLRESVRVLLIERDIGSWLSDFMREGVHSETVEIGASQYGFPLQLAGVGENTILKLATEIGRRFGTELTEYDREEILALAKEIDPSGRPLFAMIAAAAQLDGIPQHTKEEIVRSVVARETARWKSLISDNERREKTLNLLALVTILGGLRLTDDTINEVWNSAVAPLLPNPYFFDDQLYAELAGGSTGDSALQGLQPDLVGEAFVLDRLKGVAGTQISTRRLIDLGWDHNPEAVSQFVRRVAFDFPGDIAARVLQTPVSRDEVQREAWSRLVADIVPFQIGSNDDQGVQNLLALRELALKHPLEEKLKENRAKAEFNVGNLFFQAGQDELADKQFSLAISVAAKGSDSQSNALNNRGIVRLNMGSRKEGLADFSAVIANPDASDEVRACAFNNRADIFAAENDVETAIRDRSSVVSLKETSYNRRFIAHIRRSAEYLRLGRISEALDDLAAILSTDDIVSEQKMQAHLDRAWIWQQQGRSSEAIADLDRVVESPLNFEGAKPQALVLRGNAYFYLEKDEEALRDFVNALAQEDADGSTIAEAYFGSGAVLATMDQLDDARAALAAAREHPDASEEVKQQSIDLIKALEEPEDR